MQMGGVALSYGIVEYTLKGGDVAHSLAIVEYTLIKGEL